jgi:CIC family chloride channel protein
MLVTGALAGTASVGLLALLTSLEHRVWTGSTSAGAFAAASPLRRVSAVLVAGAITTAVRLTRPRPPTAPIGVLVQLWEQAGIISLGKTLARSLLSIVDVGLGAALGREGPLKALGGAIASRLARSAKLQVGQRRLLVACGMASGMASAYNVPVGGALFGLEVLLGRIEIEMVVPMIVCCAVATTVSRSLLGDLPTYHVPAYELGGPIVLVQSLVFGALVGAVAAMVLKGLRAFDSAEERDQRLAPFMPLTAMGALAIASVWLPQLLGNGYDAADAALHQTLGVWWLAMLAVLRFAATATCAAARIPGGLFTPMLSIGALVGGLLGDGLGRLWPVTPPAAFALLGMGARSWRAPRAVRSRRW